MSEHLTHCTGQGPDQRNLLPFFFFSPPFFFSPGLGLEFWFDLDWRGVFWLGSCLFVLFLPGVDH